jgi:S1-C subfamily serine protease
MGSDPCSDLAVVHFSGPLPAGTVRLPLGDSDHLHPGDTVTALGYPVTASANVYLPHLIPTTGTIQDPRVRYNDEPDIAAVIAIQHGATIQHGNSGGPLTDDKGNVIGINTLLGPEGTQSQYYALPIKEAHAETDKLMKGESVNNLGWSLTAHSVHPYNSEGIYGEKGNEIEQYLKKQGITGGMIVTSVQAGGPVDQKVQQVDLITAISNRSVNSMAQTCDIIESTLPGRDTISVDGIHLDQSQSNYGRTFHVAFKMPGSH